MGVEVISSAEQFKEVVRHGDLIIYGFERLKISFIRSKRAKSL